MDGSRFDEFARLLARPTSRRQALRGLAVVAVGVIPLAHRFRPAVAAEDLGCCKCPGANRGCMDVQNQAACDTYCGKTGIFSTKHTCTEGGAGTTKQCRLKTSTTSSDSAANCDDAVAECGEVENIAAQCDDAIATCGEGGLVVSTPVTVAALDLGARSGDGWALQEATVCYNGDACAAGGLFGDLPQDEVERIAAKLVDGYRHKTARRAATPEAPSDTYENRYYQFADPAGVSELIESLRSLAPTEATDRTSEFEVPGLAFAYSLTGPTAETLTLVLSAGRTAVLSTSLFVGGGFQVSVNEGLAELGLSLINGPVNLDAQLLANDLVFFDPLQTGSNPPGLTMTPIDGRTLLQDGESPELFAFRQLTDQTTIHGLRMTNVFDSPIGPVNVAHEIREMQSKEAASQFIAGSPERLQNYFGPALTIIPITEFNGLGDQGTGFLFSLSMENGGINGGATGYVRQGTRVGVVNVSFRTESTPSIDQLTALQDGRFFAIPGVDILSQQLEVWLRPSTSRVVRVGEEWNFD